MKHGDDALLQRLSALDPVRPEELERSTETPAAQALLASVLASEPAVPARRAPRRRSFRLAPRWALAPVAAGVVALAVFAGLPGDAGVKGGRNPLVALDLAAASAATAPAPDLSQPQYAKTRTISLQTASSGGHSWQAYRTEIRRERVATESGSGGWVRVTETPPKFLDPDARAAWEAAGKPDFRSWSESYEEPEAGAPSEAARKLTAIGRALGDPTTTPTQRAALYEATKRIPGIAYLGRAEDELGREGVAVGVATGSAGDRTLYTLIFDPRTSDVLATEATIVAPDTTADGPLLGTIVYLPS